jgi:hypothetical protein
MIRAPQTLTESPRAALAAALGGEPIGRDGILVGDTVIWASVRGVIRVGGRPVGMWSDGTEALAARVRAVGS